MPTKKTIIDSPPVAWWRRLPQAFVYENIFISFCATGLVRVAFISFGLHPSLSAVDGFVFFATLAVYNMHTGASRLKQHTPCELARVLVAKSSPLPSRFLILLALAGAGICFLFLHRWQQIATVVLGLVTLGYTFPLVRIRNTRRRFREMYIVKVMTIGIVWSFVTGLFPLLPGPVPVLPMVLFLAERTLFIVAITVPFEIRDMEQEKVWGNVTLPVAIGIRRSRYLALVMLVVHDLLVLIHWRIGGLQPPVAAALALSVLPAMVVVGLTRPGRSLFFYKFCVDGTMLLQFLFVTFMN